MVFENGAYFAKATKAKRGRAKRCRITARQKETSGTLALWGAAYIRFCETNPIWRAKMGVLAEYEPKMGGETGWKTYSHAM